MRTDDDAADGLSGLSELWLADDEAGEGRSPLEMRRRRRRRRIAGIITALVMVAILAGAGGYVAWALTTALPTPAVASETPPVPAPVAASIALPADGASAISIAGADAYLGADASGIWATSGTDEPRSIASISKLITALVILDAKPLAGPDDPGPTITFDKADHDLYDAYYVRGATIAPMPTGSSMSEYDALATMLIPSASNYAEAVSTWAFGSQSAFLSATRRWLADHGLTGTTIVEPTGLNPRNVSTPTDLIALGKLAAANPTIARICATPSLTLPGPGTINNTNGLLGVDGIDGLKTGTLGENSSALLYTATLDVGAGAPVAVTGVMLGGQSSDSVDASVRALLGSIDQGFHDVELATPGQDVGSISTAWGASARLVIGESAAIFTWSDTPITMTMDLTAPVSYQDGEKVGTITWTAGPNTAEAVVKISGTIEPPTQWWRLTHPEELAGG